MIRVLLADDHALMREGLKLLFALNSDIEVVAEAENGARVLEQLRCQAVDLVLLDISMPGVCGEDLVGRIHGHYPQLPMLALTMHNEPQVALRVLRAGAKGYLTKDQDPDVLLSAVRKVAAGARYIDPQLVEQIALSWAEPYQRSGLNNLTDREFQVMRLLAKGLSVNQVAEQLVISNKTVSTHKVRLMEKMGFHNNTDLVKFAIDQSLI
ncbi:MAG TPA: response regulator transcription factor [Pseudomonas sp.]|nr:response regulator transcription factor [Pseudomonas sp.]